MAVWHSVEETSGWLTAISFMNQQFWHCTDTEINFMMLFKLICALLKCGQMSPCHGRVGGGDIVIALFSE